MSAVCGVHVLIDGRISLFSFPVQSSRTVRGNAKVRESRDSNRLRIADSDGITIRRSKRFSKARSSFSTEK